MGASNGILCKEKVSESEPRRRSDRIRIYDEMMLQPDTRYLSQLSFQATGPGITVCFVCAGNICRSPMAEAVARARSVGVPGFTGRFESAGTGGWHQGSDADPRARAALAKAGYSLVGHRARRYQDEWTGAISLVVALDVENHRDLASLPSLRRDPEKLVLLRSFSPAGAAGGKALDVPDPYLGGPAEFEASLRIIEESLQGLLGALGASPRA